LNAKENAENIEFEMPGDFVKEICKNTNANILIKNGLATMKLSKQALESISSEDDSVIKVNTNRVKTSALSDENKKIVGDNPVYDFIITSNEKIVKSFGGNIEVNLPYTLKSGEKSDNIIIYSIDDNGKAVKVPNAVYDKEISVLSLLQIIFQICNCQQSIYQ
jgi:hypothetical protein